MVIYIYRELNDVRFRGKYHPPLVNFKLAKSKNLETNKDKILIPFFLESKKDANSGNESYGETDENKNRFFASRRKIDLFFEPNFNRSELVN